MSLHRTVEVLAFAKPIVKGTALVIDVVSGAGEGLQITITLALWHQLNAGVVAAEQEPAGIASRALKDGRRDGRSKVSTATVVSMEAAYDRWVTRHATMTVLAAELNVGIGTVSNHFKRIRSEREAHGGAPVLKPGGRL